MQPITKKKTVHWKHPRILALLLAVLLLAAAAAVVWVLNRPTELPQVEDAVTYGELYSYETDQVKRMALTLRNGDSYALVQETAGTLSLEGQPDFAVSKTYASNLLNAAAVISYDDILADSLSDVEGSLADFGLDAPYVVLQVTYADATEVTVRVGNTSPLEDEGWYFMTVDGDPRLFALDKGTAENLYVEKALLHAVTQPTIHKARLDSITFTVSDGSVRAAWELDGKITDSDAASAWVLTAPCRYPTETEAMTNLRTNLGNLRLGAYVCDATDETRAAYGLDAPAFTLTLHMAAGTTATTSAEGAYQTVDWPESTFVMKIGSDKSDVTKYVEVDGAIYLCSQFSLSVFTDMDPMDTVSRYLLPASLDSIASVVCDVNGEVTTYKVWHEEQIAENNELVTDTEGNVLMNDYCTRNGESLDYSVFAAAWEELSAVKVGGFLPDDWQAAESPYATYTFTTETGRVHTVKLAAFDALHDAVYVDDTALFYLLRGGWSFDPK